MIRKGLPIPDEADRRLAWYLSRELTRAEIAAEFGMSYEGARSRVTRLYRRLGVHTRRAAVDAARRRGWLVDMDRLQLLRSARSVLLRDVVALDAFQLAVDAHVIPGLRVRDRLARWNVTDPEHLYEVVAVLARLVPIDQPISTLLPDWARPA